MALIVSSCSAITAARAVSGANMGLAYTTGPFSVPRSSAMAFRTPDGLILYGAVGSAVTGPPLAHC